MDLTSNKAVETAAIDWVIEVERDAGRDAVDARGSQSRCGHRDPTLHYRGEGARTLGTWPRPVARAITDRGGRLQRGVLRLRGGERTPGDSAHFQLRVLGGRQLRTLLERSRERRYFTVPWPVSRYDAMPRGLR